MSARTLETQFSRPLSRPAAEIRLLGEELREAATGPAWNLNDRAAQAIIDKIATLDDEIAPDLAAQAAAILPRKVRTAPTLVNMRSPAITSSRPTQTLPAPPLSC